MSSSSIQRAAERYALDSIAIVRGVGAQVFKLRDLSELGVFMWSSTRPLFDLRLGRTFDVDLFTHDESMRCHAVIVRLVEPGTREAFRHPHGFAARLIYGDQTRPRIRELVRDARRARGTQPPPR
ncbi:MAG: hypothetical protein R2939_22855 [Kofleriaceae bacterium]